MKKTLASLLILGAGAVISLVGPKTLKGSIPKYFGATIGDYIDGYRVLVDYTGNCLSGTLSISSKITTELSKGTSRTTEQPYAIGEDRDADGNFESVDVSELDNGVYNLSLSSENDGLIFKCYQEKDNNKPNSGQIRRLLKANEDLTESVDKTKLQWLDLTASHKKRCVGCKIE